MIIRLLLVIYFVNIFYSQYARQVQLDIASSGSKVISLNEESLSKKNGKYLNVISDSSDTLINMLTDWKSENKQFKHYSVKIKNAEDGVNYAILIKPNSSHVRLYLNNNLLFDENDLKEKKQFQNNPIIIPIQLKNENELVYELKSSADFFYPILFGEINKLYVYSNNKTALEFFYFGAFIIIGFYLSIIFISRKEYKYLIMLGISCFLLSFRMLVTELNYFGLFEQSLNSKLNAASHFLLLYVLFLYFKFILETKIDKKVSIFYTAITGAFLSLLFLSDKHFDFKVVFWFSIILLPAFLYLSYYFYLFTKENKLWGRGIFASLCFFILLSFYDFFAHELNELLGMKSAELLLCFVLYNIIIISIKYAKTHEINKEYLENQKKIAKDNENIGNEISILNDVLQDMNRELEAKVQDRSLELIVKNKQLQVANERSERANRSKTVFFSFMTHELRTPINAVLGYSDLLREDMKEDNETKYIDDVEKIFEAGNHLLEVVNNLLDFAKLEAGKMLVSAEPFSSKAFVEEVKNAIYPIALKNNNKFVIETNIVSAQFHNDRLKMKIVLINLLSNSCKFTKEGEVKLIITETDKRLQFEVIDTGMGMTERQQKNLFKEFSQADGSISKNFGGSGLGLMITKKYCELLMGGISVKSEYGEGTTFKVLIKKEMKSTEASSSESKI